MSRRSVVRSCASSLARKTIPLSRLTPRCPRRRIGERAPSHHRGDCRRLARIYHDASTCSQADPYSASTYAGNDFTHLLVFTGRPLEEIHGISYSNGLEDKPLGWTHHQHARSTVPALRRRRQIDENRSCSSGIHTGFSTSLAVPIGAVLLACTILYVIPSTSILGAILLAAYLGGATVTHLRAGQPFYFPIIFGVLVWGGLYLREDRLHALIPLRSPNTPSQAH